MILSVNPLPYLTKCVDIVEYLKFQIFINEFSIQHKISIKSSKEIQLKISLSDLFTNFDFSYFIRSNNETLLITTIPYLSITENNVSFDCLDENTNQVIKNVGFDKDSLNMIFKSKNCDLLLENWKLQCC